MGRIEREELGPVLNQELDSNASVINQLNLQVQEIENEISNLPTSVTSVNGKTGTIVTLKAEDIFAEDGTTVEDLKTENTKLFADIEYQTPTIVGTQIRITKQSNTKRLYFKLDSDLTGGSITISLDGGTTSLNLKDIDGNNVTELSKGFVEVVDNGTFFTYAPKRGMKINGQDIVNAVYQENINKLDTVYLKGLYNQDESNKLANPDLLPTNVAYCSAFSPDGTYMVIGFLSSPYIYIYKRNGDIFTKLSNPSTLPANYVKGIAFSPDGNYIVTGGSTGGSSSSPFINIYKRSGDDFIKLADPTILPTGLVYDVAFSTDGNYLAVAHDISPFITIYKRSGDTFTKLTNPTVLPTDYARGIAFSPDGNYLAVTADTTNYMYIYKRNGDTFTKLSNPTITPGVANKLDFSPDGNYLAVSSTSSPYLFIYKRSGDVFTKLANPTDLPVIQSEDVAFSPDGIYMAVTSASANYIYVYKRSGDTFTKLANPSTLPTGRGYGVTFSADGTYLVVSHITAPFITIYKGKQYSSAAFKSTLISNLLSDLSIIGLGYAKENGVSDETKQIVRLWR